MKDDIDLNDGNNAVLQFVAWYPDRIAVWQQVCGNTLFFGATMILANVYITQKMANQKVPFDESLIKIWCNFDDECWKDYRHVFDRFFKVFKENGKFYLRSNQFDKLIGKAESLVQGRHRSAVAGGKGRAKQMVSTKH